MKSRLTYPQVCEALLESPWQFAKTMPDNPHWYTLRKKWKDGDLFEDVVQFIRDVGYWERYARSYYKMLDINGMKYWTMGSRLDKTILINRAYQSKDIARAYDDIADLYDLLHNDAESYKENQEIIKELNLQGSVLDIGCGTGLFLDYCSIDPSDYLGIDISPSMVKRAQDKHPDYAHRILESPFESFVGMDRVGEQFDNVIALFGSISYINPQYLDKIKQVYSGEGRVFLMFYSLGYSPVTYRKSNKEVFHYPISEFDLIDYQCRRYNNFVIAEMRR